MRSKSRKGASEVRLPERPAPVLEPEPIADDEEASPRNVPLRQLLADPEPLAGKLITLEQVYCVGKAPWRLADGGSLQVALIESDLDLTAGSARVRLRDSYQLGLDPHLAKQLIRLGHMHEIADSEPASPDWIMQPANLTVKVADASRGTRRASPDRPARVIRELQERGAWLRQEEAGCALQHPDRHGGRGLDRPGQQRRVAEGPQARARLQPIPTLLRQHSALSTAK